LPGGRGLGTFKNGLQGGVHIIKSTEVEEYATKMLNQVLVTKQTGPEGKPVNTLLLAKKMNLVRLQDGWGARPGKWGIGGRWGAAIKPSHGGRRAKRARAEAGRRRLTRCTLPSCSTG
jgi:hypothetical protein